MADEKPTGQYQFPGQGSNEEYGKSSVSGGTENVKSILTNRRVLILLGVVVVAIALWVVNREESSDDDVSDTSIPKIEAPEPVVPSPPVIEQPVAPEIPVVHTSPKLESDIDQLGRRLDGYDHQINTISVSVQQLNASNYEMTRQLQRIAKDIEELKPKKKPAKIAVEHKKVVLKTYYIRAIIDGRAWIRSGLSDNMTIKLGDEVPTYGKVKGIYPNEGVITTTSDRTIVFSNE